MLGVGLGALGLGGVVFALIEQPRFGWQSPVILIPLAGGVASLVAFVAHERRAPEPMLKLELFTHQNFALGNLETLSLYAGLGILFFYLTIYLQQVAGYSALRSGLTTLPVTLVMFALSRRFGALADRFGPRLFMGAGPLIAAAGLLPLAQVGENVSYLTDLLPGLLVFALGLSLTVAPLTATVLADTDKGDAGIASAVNNAVARVASLIGISVVGIVVAKTLVGDTFAADSQSVQAFHEVIVICIVLLAAGGARRCDRHRQSAAARRGQGLRRRAARRRTRGCSRFRARPSPERRPARCRTIGRSGRGGSGEGLVGHGGEGGRPIAGRARARPRRLRYTSGAGSERPTDGTEGGTRCLVFAGQRTESRTSRGGRHPTQLTIKWGHEQPGTGGPMNVTSKTTTHEKLSELSERAKTAEEHGEAAETKAKTELEQSARRARATAQAQADKLRETARSNEADVSESWKAQQDAWHKHMTKMREDHGGEEGRARRRQSRAACRERRRRRVVRDRLRLRRDRRGGGLRDRGDPREDECRRARWDFGQTSLISGVRTGEESGATDAGTGCGRRAVVRVTSGRDPHHASAGQAPRS